MTDIDPKGHLNGHHRKTLASIFRHPLSHNVEWHDVLSLLDHIGTTTEKHGGGLEVEIGSDRCTLNRSRGKDVEGDELRRLRTFLTQVGISPAGPQDAAAARAEPAGQQCIVLIDHHQARLFRLDGEPGAPVEPLILKPEDADGSLRKTANRQGNDDHDGGHAPEESGYYERVSTHLEEARQIVLFSDGKGRSNAGEHLVGYLKRYHPGLARRIVATERVDIAHLSDREIVAEGRALMVAA